MVAVTSPQPNEVEQKKRKQTLERAKANHLSKQLQMRLQYAKLKVEHGWQRQNLNEVENLYFHHSHLRNMQPSAVGKAHYANVTSASTPVSESAAPMAVDASSDIQLSTSPGVPDRNPGPSPLHQTSSSPPLENHGSLTLGVLSASLPSRSQPEQNQNSDARPRPPSQPSTSTSHPATLPESHPPDVETPAPVPASPSSRPPSTFDFSDPAILARLAQLQAQSQSQTLPQSQSQTQTQPLSRQPTTSAPLSTSFSQPGSLHPQAPAHPHPSFPQQPFPAQGQVAFLTPPSYMPTAASQPPFNAFAHTPPLHPTPLPASSASASTAPPSASTPVSAHSTSATVPALTYDSFWSTHASSTGTTRALYRTHTGFSASAAPNGHMAMLTPGGHAAVMTAEGVYVGGGRSA